MQPRRSPWRWIVTNAPPGRAKTPSSWNGGGGRRFTGAAIASRASCRRRRRSASLVTGGTLHHGGPGGHGGSVALSGGSVSLGECPERGCQVADHRGLVA